MQQYYLSEQALSLWLNYVEHQVGFILPKSQNNWVKGIIERHMRRNALDSTALLQTIVQDATIYHQLIDDILIPRPSFFGIYPLLRLPKRLPMHGIFSRKTNNVVLRRGVWGVRQGRRQSRLHYV